MEEVLRVVETSAEHPLVSFTHQIQGIASAIPYRNEFGEQLAGGILDREEALMLLHRRDEHRSRKIKILRFKRSQQRCRPLDQPRVLVEQSLVPWDRAA